MKNEYQEPTPAWDLPRLNALFFALKTAQNETICLQHEEQKLDVLLVIKVKLQNVLLNKPLSYEKRKSPVPPSKILSSLYRALIILGMLQQSVGSYLFATTLFLAIPGLPQALLTILSVIYILLDAVMFYAFSESFLRVAFQLPHRTNDAISLLKLYKEQFMVTLELNQHLTSIHVLKMDEQQYQDYKALVLSVNQDLIEKNEQIQDISNLLFNKVITYTLVGFGLLSTIASSYYMGVAYAAVIAPYVGLSIASAMILLTLISGLNFYFAIGVSSIQHVANFNKETFDALKKELSALASHAKNDFSEVEIIKTEISSAKKASPVVSTSYSGKLFDQSTPSRGRTRSIGSDPIDFYYAV